MPQRQNPHKREKSAWRTMIRRCTDPKFKSFNRYGGAGIRVCPEWMEIFARFLQDMGPAPTQAHWLGRLNVQGNYEPGNCLWTLQAPQERRRTYCRKVSHQGQVMTAAEAARLSPVTRDTYLRRLSSDLPPETPGKLYKASKWLTYQGQTKPLPEWARLYGMTSGVLWQRINRGWSVDRALLQPRRRAPATR